MLFQTRCTLQYSSKRMKTCVDGVFCCCCCRSPPPPHPPPLAKDAIVCLCSLQTPGVTPGRVLGPSGFGCTCAFFLHWTCRECRSHAAMYFIIHVPRHILQKSNPPTNKFCGKMIFRGDGRSELRITRQKRRGTEWVKRYTVPVR